MENYQFESVRCTVELVWILAIRWNMIVISAFSAAGGECEKHTRSQHQMSSVFSVHCTCVNGQLETSKWWYRNQKLTEKNRKQKREYLQKRTRIKQSEHRTITLISLVFLRFPFHYFIRTNRLASVQQTMAYQTFLQEYLQIPICTRIYTTACVITTIAVVKYSGFSYKYSLQ